MAQAKSSVVDVVMERISGFMLRRGTWVHLLLLLMIAFRFLYLFKTDWIFWSIGWDSRQYIAGSRAIAQGLDPISPTLIQNGNQPSVTGYIYPPFLAWLLVPTAAFDPTTANWIWLAVLLVLSLLLIPAARYFVGWQVALVGVIGFLPVWESAWMGEINAVIALASLLAFVALDQERPGRAGFFFGLGALLKLVPGICLLILLFRRQWRPLAAAIGLALAVFVAALPLVSLQTWLNGTLFPLLQQWSGSYMLSWTSILHRLYGQTGYVAGTILTIVMLGITFWRAPRTTTLLAVSAGLLVSPLVARMAWLDHSVMVLPALTVLWRTSRRGRLLAGLSWFSIIMIGGLAMPISLTVCWLTCCWPELLRDQAVVSKPSLELQSA